LISEILTRPFRASSNSAKDGTSSAGGKKLLSQIIWRKSDSITKRGVEWLFGRFEIDSEFRAKHPAEFTVASRNRDRVFSYVEDPIMFLRESDRAPLFVFFSSCSFEEFVETYGLDGKKKSSKQLFQRLCGYAEAIKALLKEELRRWPMRAFIKPPLPRQFQFSNKRGMAAAVTIFCSEA